MGNEIVKEVTAYDRQAGLVDNAVLQSTGVCVAGVGAVGRQCAIQLSVMGVRDLCVVDPDTIELVNVGSQGYRLGDIGNHKAWATAYDIEEMTGDLGIEYFATRWNVETCAKATTFLCVDSIETRKEVFEALWEHRDAQYLVDGRMSGNSLRVLCCDLRVPEDVQAYERTLFPGEEAFQGPCTGRMTFYGASVCAGLMVSKYCQLLGGKVLNLDVQCNLSSDEMFPTTDVDEEEHNEEV